MRTNLAGCLVLSQAVTGKNPTSCCDNYAKFVRIVLKVMSKIFSTVQITILVTKIMADLQQNSEYIPR